MKKTNKLILVTGMLLVTILGIFGISEIKNRTLLKSNVNSHAQAYNHTPNNILDNVLEQDGIKILPFIFENSDVTIPASYVKSQLEKVGQTVQSITSGELITTGTIIKTNTETYNVVIYGDVDSDGYVDVFDAQAILRHYVFAGEYELKGIYKIAANVDNEDEEIDVFDAQRILRFFVGYETKLVVNEPISIKEQDHIKPVITLNGNSIVTVNLGSRYTDAGAMATDNKDGNITSRIKVTNNVNINRIGTYTVVYTVTDNAGNTASTQRTVNVVDYVTGITVTAPSKTQYKYGEDINYAGMLVQKVMKSGSKITLSENEYTVTGYNKTLVGTQTITVNHNGKTATFNVNVNNYITGIELTTIPTKIEYVEGEDIDLSGMKLNAIMANSTKQEISSSDANLTVNPKTNISYSKDNIQVELIYTTTNTINDKSLQFKATFDITVKKKVSILEISKEQDSGYTLEEFIYGTIDSGENEASINELDLKYQVKNESGDDITSQGIVIVRFEEEVARPGEILIKILAKEAGIYKITPYIGNSIDSADVIKATEQEITITDDTTIETVEIVEFNNVKLNVNKVIEKELTFKNKQGITLGNVISNQIEIIANGVEIVLLEHNNPGPIVTGLQIKAITEGTHEIQVKVNKGTENEKTISLGSIEVLPELAKTLDIQNISEVTILQEEPLTEQSDIAIVNGKVYTLIPLKLIEAETLNEIAIKADELIIGDATETKRFSVTYTGYVSTQSPLLDIQMFNNKTIETTSVDAEYLGIALARGTRKIDIEGKELILKYGNSQVNLSIEIEDMRIKNLEVTQKNVDTITNIPTIENHIRTSIGTISSGEGQEELLMENLKYRVKNEAGEDITSQGIVTVEFGEEVLEAGEIQIYVQTEKEGIYTIIPYVEVNGNEVRVEQEVESINNPIVTTVEIENIATAEIKEKEAFESKIIFKNKYGDILTNVKKNTIEVSGDDLNITLLKDKNPIQNDDDNVTDIQIMAQTKGDKNINITVNKGTSEKKTITLQFTAKEMLIELNVNNMQEIHLYETEPQTTTYTLVTDNGYIYTLVPISLTGTDITIKGGDIGSNKLICSLSNNDMASMSVQLFDENKVVTNTGDTATYIGFALGRDYTETEMNGVAITLTYETSSKTIIINNS